MTIHHVTVTNVVFVNVYMCEKVQDRAFVQCWREFAKCRFTHFPSFFSVHVDTYDICEAINSIKCHIVNVD